MNAERGSKETVGISDELKSTVEMSKSPSTTAPSVFVSLKINRLGGGCGVIVLTRARTKKNWDALHNLSKHPPQISPPSLT